LPGTSSIQNAIPMPFFSTTPFAAPGLGIIASIIKLGFGLWRLRHADAAALLRARVMERTHRSASIPLGMTRCCASALSPRGISHLEMLEIMNLEPARQGQGVVDKERVEAKPMTRATMAIRNTSIASIALILYEAIVVAGVAFDS